MDDAHRTADGAIRRLHATRPRPDRVFLVGAELTDTPESWPAEDSLGELELLAETDGLEVVGSAYQRLKRPNARFYIGSGKVAEIAELRERLSYNLVIFDDELSPSQARNLEEALDTPVLDRTGLILDIFARHAHTHEGRIQVELAQYNYMLPRLRGRGGGRQVSASGTAAGGVVGLRGPGETQLELDRRRIRGRTADLRALLEEVRQQRELYRRQRRESGVPVVALIGYYQFGQEHPAQRADHGRRRRRGPPVRDARPDHPPARSARRLSGAADRHGRFYPEAAHPAGGGLPRHAGGDPRGRPAAGPANVHGIAIPNQFDGSWYYGAYDRVTGNISYGNTEVDDAFDELDTTTDNRINQLEGQIVQTTMQTH